MNASYGYIYGAHLSEARYERELAAIETSLAEYDVGGRIARLALFRSPQEPVEGMVRQGVKTIVVVGTEETLDAVLPIAVRLKTTIGFIPCGAQSALASALHIAHGKAACDVIAARRIETFDIGLVNGAPFFTEVSFEASTSALEIEGRYRVSSPSGGRVHIRNLACRTREGMELGDAHDALLEAIVNTDEGRSRLLAWLPAKDKERTKIYFERAVALSDQEFEVKIDTSSAIGTRFEFGLLPQGLTMITGRRQTVLPNQEGSGTFRPAKR